MRHTEAKPIESIERNNLISQQIKYRSLNCECLYYTFMKNLKVQKIDRTRVAGDSLNYILRYKLLQFSPDLVKQFQWLVRFPASS